MDVVVIIGVLVWLVLVLLLVLVGVRHAWSDTSRNVFYGERVAIRVGDEGGHIVNCIGEVPTVGLALARRLVGVSPWRTQGYPPEEMID